MSAPVDATAIYLRKSLKVVLPMGGGHAAPGVIAAAAKNLQSLGFGISPALWDRLATLPDDEVVAWYESVLPALREMVGAHRPFEPMYPNFPKQVMEASEAELYFNAVTNYFGFAMSDLLSDPSFVVLPRYEKEPRSPLGLRELRLIDPGSHDLRWIELGSERDFDGLFTRLAASNGSLSEFDRRVLRWFAANRDVTPLLPESIRQKETLALLVAALPDPTPLVGHVRTATDALRVAVAMSGGDLSLAEPTKFRSFSKRERRFLLGCLERTGETRIEDMLRWKERWVRLGERLHPGDFKARFPQALAAFDAVRNGEKVETFNSKAEATLKAGDAAATLDLLTRRPGDFARRLDHALRRHADQHAVLDGLLAVADRVSTPVLLQAWAHFRRRDADGGRAFFPKGNAAKVQFKQEKLPPLRDGIAEAVADGLRRVLVGRFGGLPPLGKVFIDDRLKEQFVPFSQRSASRSLRTVARGSRFDLPPGDTVRFFLWWKNVGAGEEWQHRVDLDLSASLFDADWNHVTALTYYNLREGRACHSGDITSAPEGACEFIDIDLTWVPEKAARYVVMSVLSFSSQPFVALPECFCGWMARARPDSGEVFEPRTVQDKADLTAPSRACVPVILDVAERKVFWTDLGLKTYAQINNAARNSVGFSQIGRAIVGLKKPTLHDLFRMHAEARGEVVGTRAEAETVFGLHDGAVTAFDTDVILSNFLA